MKSREEVKQRDGTRYDTYRHRVIRPWPCDMTTDARTLEIPGDVCIARRVYIGQGSIACTKLEAL